MRHAALASAVRFESAKKSAIFAERKSPRGMYGWKIVPLDLKDQYRHV